MSKYKKEYDEYFSRDSVLNAFNEKFSDTKIRGIDNKNADDFYKDLDSHIDFISKSNLNGTYKFLPYLETLKSKGKNKIPRVIAVPSVRDRITLYQLKEYLNFKFPVESRPELANAIVNKVSKTYSDDALLDSYSVVKVDIQSFYDKIPHSKLIRRIREDVRCLNAIKLIRGAISNNNVARGVKASAKNLNKIGVHQGLSISNILASIYLGGIDVKYSAIEGVFYFRFVDDILLICRDDLVKNMTSMIFKDLSALGLKAHPLDSGKSIVLKANDKFDYLGYSFHAGSISVRKGTEVRFINEISRIVTEFKYKSKFSTNIEVDSRIAIEVLNEKITGAYSEGRRYGWIAFYSQINDSKLLAKMDFVIHKLVSSNIFLNPLANDLKKLKRAIYTIKYSPEGGYVHNYDRINTVNQKISYLVKRGEIDAAGSKGLTEVQINDLYEKTKNKYLAGLQMDESLRS